MNRFAFVVHPISVKDYAKKYPIAKYLPDSWVEWMGMRKSPVVASEVKGCRSITGEEIEGWLIGCPLTPSMMMDRMPLEDVYERIIQCCELGSRLGAQIIGLGAFTSVVGDGGITVESRSPIPVTTGNSYTVATSIEGAIKAAAMMDVTLSEATFGVVGATGSIGRTCAMALAPKMARTILVGRDQDRTQAVADSLPRATATTEPSDLRACDIIITVTSSDTSVILPEHLKQGAIVCDVARPRDVSVRVAKERPDVLVVEGGVVRVPGDVDFGMTFGFPPKTTYACMSETMMLALEGRFESFTLGKEVSLEQVEQTQVMAAKHGFHLSGFRSFEREVTESEIARARDARRAAATVLA